jgi:hypothetical protein
VWHLWGIFSEIDKKGFEIWIWVLFVICPLLSIMYFSLINFKFSVLWLWGLHTSGSVCNQHFWIYGFHTKSVNFIAVFPIFSLNWSKGFWRLGMHFVWYLFIVFWHDSWGSYWCMHHGLCHIDQRVLFFFKFNFSIVLQWKSCYGCVEVQYVSSWCVKTWIIFLEG